MDCRIRLLAYSLLIALSGAASAQSTSGNISGDANAGDTIVVRGDDNGFKRDLTIKKAGKYRIGHVPTGRYHVTFIHEDGQAYVLQDIMVRPDGTTQVSSPGKAVGDSTPLATP